MQGKAARRWLWALLLLTFIKGWLWAAAFPPFQPSDELHHLGYARDILRERTLMVEPREIFVPEEVVAMEIARLVEVSGYRQPLNLSPTRIQGIEQARSQLRSPLDQPPAEISPWVKFFSRHHPPLYYAVGAALAWLFQPTDMLEHLALGRLFSVFLTVATIGFVYLLAQQIWPDRPYLWVVAALLVSFAPMVTYMGAVFSNQAPELTLFTALFWLMALVVRRGISWPIATGLAAVLGIGLLTKVSFLVCLPLLLLVAIYDGRRGHGRWLPWLFVAIIPLLLAAPWYVDYLRLSQGGLADARPEAAGCPAFPTYLTQLPLRSLWLRFWRESVASFGHRDSLWPEIFYQATLLGLGLAMAGWGRAAYAAWKEKHAYQFEREQWFLGVLFVLAWLGTMAFYIIIGYLVSCDRRAEYTQGRLLLPILPALILFLLMGWVNLTKKYQQFLLAALVLIFVVLNSYSLWQSVIWRYYGNQQFMSVPERDVLSNPLTADSGVSQCFTLTSPGLNRVDIWLEKVPPGNVSDLQLLLADADGKEILTTAGTVGWNTLYPAYFEFAPLDEQGTVCITITAGAELPTRAWASETAVPDTWYDGSQWREGSLSVNLYQALSWRQIPGRITVQASDRYTTGFYWILGMLYVISLSVFVVLLLWHLLTMEIRTRANATQPDR